jgi:hypothetical protein
MAKGILSAAFFYQMRNHEQISVSMPQVRALINDNYFHVNIIKQQ